MANEAHKEPTMEEILASIRKIISDDDLAPQPAADVAPEVVEDVTGGEEEFEALDLGETAEGPDDVMFEEDDQEDAPDEAALEAELESFEAELDDLDEPPSFEEMLGAARAVVAAPKEEAETEIEDEAETFEFDEEPAFEPEPEPVIKQPIAAAPVEEDMAASPAYQQTILTDDKTADSAAGALGKLISKMDLGGDNTIEGLVREMLKPMMKEWLDANLPKIVEEKVEAEVQRIARMAR